MERLTNAEIEAIRKRAESAAKANYAISYITSILISEDIPKLLAEIDRLRGELSEAREYNEYYFDLCKERKREIERLQSENDKLEYFLQEIDTHIRSTPDALPYILGTMRKFWDYREGYSDDQTQ